MGVKTKWILMAARNPPLFRYMLSKTMPNDIPRCDESKKLIKRRICGKKWCFWVFLSNLASLPTA
jgi:hypothetical protein